MFTAVQLQLSNIGGAIGQGTLRQQFVAYLEDHPYTHDGTHLRDFIAAPFVGSDPRNADTEMPNEDEVINSIEDNATQLQLRWHDYLDKLGSTAWGDPHCTSRTGRHASCGCTCCIHQQP